MSTYLIESVEGVFQFTPSNTHCWEVVAAAVGHGDNDNNGTTPQAEGPEGEDADADAEAVEASLARWCY